MISNVNHVTGMNRSLATPGPKYPFITQVHE